MSFKNIALLMLVLLIAGALAFGGILLFLKILIWVGIN